MTSDATSDACQYTLFLSDSDVATVLDWTAAVKALREAYAADITPEAVPPRAMARGDGVWLRSMTAVSARGGHLGAKLISASPKTRRVSYLVALFEDQTMALDALIDGNRITGIRTAATSAMAAEALAPARPVSVAVLGTGFEARNHIRALGAVCTIATARVYSPTPANRQRFAEEVRAESGLDITAAESAQVAVTGADVIICAARSHDESPVLHAEWLSPAATVVSVGSTLPEQRELDVEVFRRAGLIVADVPEEAAHDTGDLLAAAAAGIDVSAKLASLGDLIGGAVRVRQDPQSIVVYKSVGSALQDIVVAEQILASARRRGLGTRYPNTIVPITK
ncbi:ornithine cyclodeaminase family protein [Mycobacterium sp. OAE908]|uniref:ornithine cyclodeaminase family protein n=1 Tax=Mycobacterium sp. OAE908 TaxID=2817899 RepID=UPI001AE23276